MRGILIPVGVKWIKILVIILHPFADNLLEGLFSRSSRLVAVQVDRIKYILVAIVL